MTICLGYSKYNILGLVGYGFVSSVFFLEGCIQLSLLLHEYFPHPDMGMATGMRKAVIVMIVIVLIFPHTVLFLGQKGLFNANFSHFTQFSANFLHFDAFFVLIFS